MFGRSDQNTQRGPQPIGGGVQHVQSGPQSVATPSGRVDPFTAAQVMGTSVIGTDLTILGDKITIISQNRLQIDGDIRGDVNGRQVVIGEDGSVVGTVSAEAIEVRGGVRGAIRAATVTLHPTAQVDGEITHQTLAISEGAQFDGRVRRAKDANELKPVLDPAQFQRIEAVQRTG